MRALLSEIRAIRRAYYVDHTVMGDVLDTFVAVICTAGLLGHIWNLLDLLERQHG